MAWSIGLNSISLVLDVNEEGLVLAGSGRHHFWPDDGSSPAAFVSDINRKIATVSAYRGVPDHYGKAGHALDDLGRGRVDKFRISSHRAICVIHHCEDEVQFTIYTKETTFQNMRAIFELALTTGREITIDLDIPKLGRNSEAFMLGRVAHVGDLERVVINRPLERT